MITLGLECCLADPHALMRGKRFGLLLNQASIDRDFRYAHSLLHERFPGQLAALFGPQHGLWSEQQDNMVETAHTTCKTLAIPLYSLYAEHRKPTPAMLDDLDLFVVDLQDVGTRVYTYIWTLAYCLEACAEKGIPVLVLDRPNPIGGTVIEGPALDASFSSFVGLAPIPMRHGLTIAEMASYLNQSMGINAELHTLPMEGWQRDMYWPETGRTWVPTSPNLPRVEGLLLYPGQVMIEGTEVSEGRGTTTPFEVVGAPYIDADALEARVRSFGDPTCALRAIQFEPAFQKHAERSCAGLFIHPADIRSVRSYRLTLACIGAIQSLWPDDYAWLLPPYEYETERMPFDILSGSDRARKAIDRGLTPHSLDELCTVDVDAWTAKTADHRLYTGPAFVR